MTGSEPTQESPFLERPELGRLLLYAIGLGVFGAYGSLIFMGIIGLGNHWYHVSNPGWGGGHWWWVAVTAATGLVVGILRHVLRVPKELPGLVEDISSGEVDSSLVPGVLAVSAVSLIGGASLGPEKALGTMGGGVAGLVSRRQHVDPDNAKANTLAGFAGAYGGLFSSPVVVVMLLIELARPGGKQLTRTLVGSIVAASVSFAVYFAIAGSVFLDIYKVPYFAFHDWQLFAGVGFGVVAAVLVVILGALMQIGGRIFERVKLPDAAKPVLGGVIFGLVGVALPLTMFTDHVPLSGVTWTAASSTQ